MTFWVNNLEKHFDTEELLLLPYLSNKALSLQFVSEHEQIRNLIKEINISDAGIQDLSVKLSKSINDHIRFEERTMFPWLENQLSDKEIKEVGIALNAIQIVPHNFTPEFWKTE